MKKMLRGFALILALTLAATLCIPAFAAEGATESERNIELPTDEVLLATVQDNIDAYAEYYFLHSVTVIDKFVSKYENDSYDVDFIIDLETELKYDSAAQLPHVQGMTKSLGINSEATTTDRLIASLAEDSPTMAIAEMTLETLENKENISSNDGLAAVTKEKTAVQIATTAIADLVTELEDLYIGEISSTILSFRATFDNQGMPVSVAAVAYDGSAYDAKLLVPPSAEEMEHNGELQLADIVNAAVIAAEEPQMATQATATKETYHRVTARDYANTWTSTQPTGKKDTSKWRIAANPNAYAPLYPANSSDCANYVSQARMAGNTIVFGAVDDKIWKDVNRPPEEVDFTEVQVTYADGKEKQTDVSNFSSFLFCIPGNQVVNDVIFFSDNETIAKYSELPVGYLEQ